ncbi:MAG: Y-family DNA polymerase [Treponema sp.]|nr:Y-family DNA polymerase [Treponema sp.]
MIMHVDANSFYASCESIFRPDIQNKPVAVLSNNDGVTIALNTECKKLGFKRGDLFFKMKNEYKAKGVFVFSSNYTLYADISRRLNIIYNAFSIESEYYSIYESFLYVPDFIENKEYIELAKELKNFVWKSVHIPVSIGIAPTKTLAKMCNKLAKDNNGVFLWNSCDKENILKNYAAKDIWGIGNSKAETLARKGVFTAWNLLNFPLDKAKKELSINGFRTVQELKEIPAIDKNESTRRKNITSSRSFGKGVTSILELETALSEYTQIAVAKMRSEHSACKIISVYLMTARAFSDNNKDKEYFNGASAQKLFSTSYLSDITEIAIKLLKSIYRSGYSYRKIIINLQELEDDNDIQNDLFMENLPKIRERNNLIMDACDNVNNKYGKGTLHIGIRTQLNKPKNAYSSQSWFMTRNFLSPEYTTNIKELPIVI